MMFLFEKANNSGLHHAIAFGKGNIANNGGRETPPGIDRQFFKVSIALW